MDLSERPLRDFLEVGRGDPTHKNFKFLRFYTAWADLGRSVYGNCRLEADIALTIRGKPTGFVDRTQPSIEVAGAMCFFPSADLAFVCDTCLKKGLPLPSE
jgi:hypothetical protein